MITYHDVMKTVMENYGESEDDERRNSIFGHGCAQGGLFTPNELGEGRIGQWPWRTHTTCITVSKSHRQRAIDDDLLGFFPDPSPNP